MAHEYLAPLRWGDMDAQRHVNNAVYLDYLQDARVDYLLSGPPQMKELLDTGVLVVGHQVEYLAPVEFSLRPLRINLWVDAVGASRFVIGYHLYDGDTLAVRARTAAVPFDLAGNQLRLLTANERSVLTSALTPAEPLREVTSPRLLAKLDLSGVAASYPLLVRWSDLDSYGHVNNVKYYDYVQEARVAMVEASKIWAPEQLLMIVRQDVDYRRPLDFRSTPYEVRTVVTDLGNRSFTLAAQILDPLDGTVFATAHTVVVLDRPLTDHQRISLASYLVG